MKQPSFLIAEVVSDNNVIAATGKNFNARLNPFYVRKMPRYCYQRPVSEAYNMYVDNFLTDSSNGDLELEVVESGNFIERNVPYTEFKKADANLILGGSLKEKSMPKYCLDRSFMNVPDILDGYKTEELEEIPLLDWYKINFLSGKIHKDILKQNQYNTYEFLTENTGLITAEIESKTDSTLYFCFDEILTDGNVDVTRMVCNNIVKFNLKKGKYTLITSEVYVLKYLQLLSTKGEVRVFSVGMYEYKHKPIKRNHYKDERFEKIAAAAEESFLQNAVDLLTDCPGRERGGYCCDALFTGRTENLLTGENKIEKAFLENFLMEKDYKDIPKGLFPMCYPADIMNTEYIPQWCLWLIVEVEDYYARTNDGELVNKYKARFFETLEYFKNFENEFGLLENLPGWNFIEWSAANSDKYIKGVNFPTNMLYSKALLAMGELYSCQELIEKSRKLKQKIIDFSYNGKYFTDNAIRKGKSLVRTNNMTEACQYYAFFFDVANDNNFSHLLNDLIENLGPNKNPNGEYNNIQPANVFIGNYMRMDILLKYKQYGQVKDDMLKMFTIMADTTGTLWENLLSEASCCHGFASYAAVWLNELYKENEIE